jgi:type VI secretion system protein ImpL
VALTHLDQVEGYVEFARFVAKQKASATLAIEPGKLEAENLLEPSLLKNFAEFERLLPLALTTLPSTEYLKVVAFLREGHRYLPPLSNFLAALGARSPVGHNPVLERVYLTLSLEKSEGANPFHASKDEERALAHNPLWRHRLAAVGCVLVGVLYMGAGYVYDRRLWTPAQEAVLAYPEAKTADQERKLRQDIARFMHRRAPGRVMRYLPSFFASEEEQLEARLSHVIRAHHLLPGLEQALDGNRPHRRSLYFLGLMYATRDNALGRLIAPRVQHWSDATGIEPELIETYLRSTHEPYGEKPPLAHLPARPVLDATNDAHQWMLFFNRLQQLYVRGTLAPEELAELKQEAGVLLDALKVIRQFEQSAPLLTELEQATNFGLAATYEPARAAVNASALFGDGLPTVERLLKRVQSGGREGAELEVRLLSDLNGMLKRQLDGQPAEGGETFAFVLEKQRFSFTSRGWEALIGNGATRELVHHFIHPTGKRASIFFADTDRLDPLQMNALSDGSFLFTGKATLDGRYTRQTFDKYVRPALTEFHALAPRLGEERGELERFVLSEVRKYARDYGSQIDSYYQSFGVRVESRESLQILLRQLLGPGSPLTELLHTVRDNTQLKLDDKQVPLFAPMNEVLAKYAPLHKVVPEQEAAATEFDNYLAVLEQLRQSLGPDAVAAAPEAAREEKKEEKKEEAGAEDLQGLAEVLSPPGQLTLAMLRKEKGSYDALVRTWLSSVRLSGELSTPFMRPVHALHDVGSREIETTVARLWDHRILNELSGVMRAFPFDRKSKRDVRPEELEALFHPQTGRFHQLARRFIEPVSVRNALGWRKLDTGGSSLTMPSDLYETLNNVEMLTRRLWDSEGNPRPLRLTVASVPFQSDVKGGAVLTLVYLSSGTDSVLNFNQQPITKPLQIDWTRPRQARLSIETVAPDTGGKTYPPAILSEISPWSMLHLLAQAQRDNDQWSWEFDLGPSKQGAGQGAKMKVHFQLQDDPWALFALRPPPPVVEPLDATATNPPP